MSLTNNALIYPSVRVCLRWHNQRWWRARFSFFLCLSGFEP
jgi:hypothetical protein